MTDIRAQSRPACLHGTNGRFQQKPLLTSTALNVLSWSVTAANPTRTCYQKAGNRPAEASGRIDFHGHFSDVVK